MYTIEKKTLTDIADAIREKTGKSGLLTPSEMVSEISTMKTGMTALSVQFYSGSLDIRNGNIVDDDRYCYSDLIPISTSSGRWYIDISRSNVNSFYIGIAFYDDNGAHNGQYIRQYETYRYYSGTETGKYFRIANMVSNLSFANMAFLSGGIYVVPQSIRVYQTNLI